MTRHDSEAARRGGTARLLRCLLLALAFAARALSAEPTPAEAPLSQEQIATQFKEAARLYGERQFAAAAAIYWRLSEVPDADQAAWALELYGACQEQQGERETALAIYELWLQRYPGTAGETRVQQRRTALLTASAEPRAPRQKATGRGGAPTVFGSASVMYRGLTRKVENQDRDTPISSLAGDLDLHMMATTGDFQWNSRVTGGYLQDQSDRNDSDGRVSNLYLGITHDPTGASMTLGRQRTSEYGVYGYFDGISLSYPVAGLTTITAMAGTVADNSRDAPSSDHKVYGLSTEIHFPDPSLRLRLYGVEQTYDGITERRAIGGEFSWFNDFSYYLFIADYDLEFQETNNLMFNGNWTIGDATNLALSLGYQRSPFLSASNALIGEYDVNLDQLVAGLPQGDDIYDAALDKTALSRYASLVLNRQMSDRLRVVGEVFYYELSDLPRYDPLYDSPDSDANTTWGLQFIVDDALVTDDILSTGVRYTTGDVSDTAVLYMDEKLRLDADIDLIFRLSGSWRTLADYNQDAYTVRPGIKLDWYFTPDFLLDMEAGYEWLAQDFESENFQVHQAYIVLGLRWRF